MVQRELNQDLDFAEALVMLKDLHSALISYLKTQDSKDLLQLLKVAKVTQFGLNTSNSTHVRRGTRWDKNSITLWRH